MAAPMSESNGGKKMPLFDTAVDPDFDEIDTATDQAVDWVQRGHAYEAVGGVELELPRGSE